MNIMKGIIKKSHIFVVAYLHKHLTILKDGYLHSIWNSFKETNGKWVAIIGIASWLIPDMNIGYRIIFFLLCICCSICWALFDTGIKYFNRIYEIKVPYVMKDEKRIILLLRCGNVFPIGALVDIFVDEKNFEKYLGSGEIINIQANNLTQVRITEIIDDEIDVEKIKSNLLIRSYDGFKSNKSSR